MRHVNELLTSEDVADLLHVSLESVRRHARVWGGFKMPGAREWRFRSDDLAEVIRLASSRGPLLPPMRQR